MGGVVRAAGRALKTADSTESTRSTFFVIAFSRAIPTSACTVLPTTHQSTKARGTGVFSGGANRMKNNGVSAHIAVHAKFSIHYETHASLSLSLPPSPPPPLRIHSSLFISFPYPQFLHSNYNKNYFCHREEAPRREFTLSLTDMK